MTDGGSTSSFALSVAGGNVACPLVEEIAKRGKSPKSLRTTKNMTIKVVMIPHLNQIVSLVSMEIKEMFIILPVF